MFMLLPTIVVELTILNWLHLGWIGGNTKSCACGLGWCNADFPPWIVVSQAQHRLRHVLHH